MKSMSNMSIYHNMEPYHSDYYSNSSSSSPSSVYSMNTDGNMHYHGGNMSSPMSSNMSPMSSTMSPMSSRLSPISSSDSSSAYQFQQLQISNSSNDYIYSMNVRMDGPYLQIIDQPIDKFRFRYESEMHGTHGMLTTQHSKKSFPSVRLHNFNGEALIRCSLFQMRTSSQDVPVPHSHRLVVRCGNKNKKDPHEMTVSQQHGYTANFQGMGIIHTARKYIEGELYDKLKDRAEFEYGRKITQKESDELQIKAKKYSTDMNLNQVSLCFEAYERVNGMWTHLCPPLFSAPINNLKSALTGELKISRMSTVVGSAAGNDDLFMFVEKVGKKNIKVRFYELDGDRVVWEDFGLFTEADVHHQYAIALKTPPYRRTNIEESVKVFIQLYRPRDGAISDSVEFRYKPSYSSNRKRARVASFYDSDIPVVVNENVYNQNFTDCYVPHSSNRADDSEMELIVQDLFNNSQSELALDSEDFSSLLQTLNETAEFDKLARDSTSADITDAQTSSKDEKWVAKILRKTEPLLRIDESDEIGKVYRKFFEFLLRKARFNGDSVLHICVKSNDQKLMERLWAIFHKFQLYELLQLRNLNQETCGHLASALNKPEILKEVIKYGANANAVDVDGNTALHIAVQENHDECVNAILNSGNDIDLCILNDNGYTALHLACMNKNLRVVKMLDAQALKTKQSIFDDIEAKHGNNALHIAIEARAVDVVDYIIQNKRVSPTKVNKSGHTAVYLARVIKSIEMLNMIQCHSSVNDDQFVGGAYDDDDASSKDSFDSQDASGPTQTKKLMMLKEQFASSNKLQANPLEKPFDDQCFTELSEVFNKNSKWKSVATVLDYEDYVPTWHPLRNPTKALLMYAESLKVPKDHLIKVFTELGESRAVDCILEWKRRV